MVKVVVGIALLLAIALVGSRRTFTRLPIGPRYVFLTGTEYILVGVALGSPFLGVLDEATLLSLTPLLSLALGAVGLLFGIQLELDKIRRLPLGYLFVVVSQAVITMALVFLPAYGLLRHIFIDSTSLALGALVVAASAGCSGQTTIALLSRELRPRASHFLDLLRYIVSLDAVVGIGALGFAFSLTHTESPLGIPAAVSAQWFFLSVFLAVMMGFLLHLLSQVHCSQEELLVFALGMVLFSGGTALYFRLSPLFVNMVMGVVMANLPGARDRVFHLLARLEKPCYLVLLILAGAFCDLGMSWALLLIPTVVLLRGLGKLAGGLLGARMAPPEVGAPASMGLGLMSQGGMAVAMVLTYAQVRAGPESGAVVTAVLASVILNELASPSLIRVVLRRAGVTEP